MQAARITLPSVPCTSPAFEYRASYSTNLADTFAKARERIAAQAAQEAAAPKPQRKRPALMQVRRIRAGTTNHLSLPSSRSRAMHTFILTCGPLSIERRADTAAEAIDHGLAELGHLGHGISCRCIR